MSSEEESCKTCHYLDADGTCVFTLETGEVCVDKSGFESKKVDSSYLRSKDRLLDELDENYCNDSQIELNLTVAKLGELEREEGKRQAKAEIVERIKAMKSDKITDNFNLGATISKEDLLAAIERISSKEGK